MAQGLRAPMRQIAVMRDSVSLALAGSVHYSWLLGLVTVVAMLWPRAKPAGEPLARTH